MNKPYRIVLKNGREVECVGSYSYTEAAIFVNSDKYQAYSSANVLYVREGAEGACLDVGGDTGLPEGVRLEFVNGMFLTIQDASTPVCTGGYCRVTDRFFGMRYMSPVDTLICILGK